MASPEAAAVAAGLLELKTIRHDRSAISLSGVEGRQACDSTHLNQDMLRISLLFRVADMLNELKCSGCSLNYVISQLNGKEL